MSSTTDKLISLGTRLREARLLINESQKIVAARIGVSIPTLRKMEAGDPGVTIGHWMTAFEVLGRLKEVDVLLAASEDLFAKYDALNSPRRKRVSRKKKP